MKAQKQNKKSKKQAPFKPPEPPQILNLIKKYNTSLDASKQASGQENEEKKESKTKKKTVILETNCLLLSHNKLENIKGIYKVLEQVMYSPHKLKWLDLSHNKLKNIDEDIFSFPFLNTFYLQSNIIETFHDIIKLSRLENLRHLQLNGNPCSKIFNYRLFVIGMLQQISKLDTLIISNKERENSIFWNDKMGMERVVLKAIPPKDSSQVGLKLNGKNTTQK